jgi:bifunctional non-homologous end joining protein LigD
MAGKQGTIEVEGRKVALTNLDKVLYPGAKFTKAQVIDYYVRVSRYILPHLKDRPITLVRYPDGVRGEFFYEKNAPAYAPDWIKRFAVRRHRHAGEVRYMLINDLPTLVWAANLASLELHPFLHRVPKTSSPTEMVYDLDPGEGADVLTCARVAVLIREILAEMKLKSFVKVSGSKGLQLYVPLNGGLEYDIVKPFAKTLAELMEQRHPDLVVSKMAKSLRPGKVFIDWSQNTESKTTVGVYSLRAKSDRPYASMPVTWDELAAAERKGDAGSLRFEPEQALRRLEDVGDLFAEVEKLKQRLPRDVMTAAKRLPKAAETVEAPRARSAEESAKPSRPLEKYREKRDFSKTPEPQPVIPERSAQGSRRRFVIQKHAASHLHYDFRLEMHGVLKSWAVPKGPPLDADSRRLAMPTEDHPLDYLSFEGIIPKGEYGGGTVMVWDIGTYEVVDGNVYKGSLKFYLEGKKLKGEWLLTRSHDDGDRPKWYMIKTGAKVVRISAAADNRSALSGRTMEQIAKNPEREWHSNRGAGKKPLAKDDAVKHEAAPNLDTFLDSFLDSLPKAKIEFVEPMLARPVETPPEGEWQYEIKLDGYRALIVKRGDSVDVFSRRKNRMNSKYPGIASAFDGLAADTILDGEIVALDQDGRPNFTDLQNWRPKKPIYFYAFDVLAFKGRDVTGLPLSERRRVLEDAVAPLADPVRLSPIFDFPVEDIVRTAREQRLEGIIAKRKNSRYEAGQRSGAWVKYKTGQGQELVIGGYLPGTHVFDSLLVGYYDRGKLLFVAKVRNGFTPGSRLKVAKHFKGLETAKCPFSNLPEPSDARRGKALTSQAMKECHWLKPKLVAQVEFAEWTETDHLRHATFVALRNDKDPRDVRMESTSKGP